MTIEQIKKNAPYGAVKYGVGRVSGNPFYVNSDGLVWSQQYKEWTSFSHGIELKPL